MGLLDDAERKLEDEQARQATLQRWKSDRGVRAEAVPLPRDEAYQQVVRDLFERVPGTPSHIGTGPDGRVYVTGTGDQAAAELHGDMHPALTQQVQLAHVEMGHHDSADLYLLSDGSVFLASNAWVLPGPASEFAEFAAAHVLKHRPAVEEPPAPAPEKQRRWWQV
jgi:hypothetical protein